MANAVARTIDKVLPPADGASKKSASKTPSAPFEAALKRARPKREEVDARQVSKKQSRAARPKREAPKSEVEAPKSEKPSSDRVKPKRSDEAAQDVPADEAWGDESQTQKTDAKPASEKPGTASSDATPTEAQTQEMVAAIHPDAKQQQPEQSETDESDACAEADGDVMAEGTATVAHRRAETKSAALAKPVAESPEGQETIPGEAIGPAMALSDVDVPAETISDDATNAVKKQTPRTASSGGEATDGIALGDTPPTEQTATNESAIAPVETEQAIAPIAEATSRASSDDLAPDTEAHPKASPEISTDLQPKPQLAPPSASRPAAPPPPPPAPEVRFAEANHPQIVTGMRGQLLPDGGTMHIRLDPPELGALQVSIHMQDGVMTASFQTTNDDATRLLSHSLAQLKHVLESQGVSVDKLNVTQASRDQQAANDDNRQQQGNNENPQARQEQQRREILQRMWRKLTDGSDPLDMVA